jgi:hypothetical protein
MSKKWTHDQYQSSLFAQTPKAVYLCSFVLVLSSPYPLFFAALLGVTKAIKCRVSNSQLRQTPFPVHGVGTNSMYFSLSLISRSIFPVPSLVHSICVR